MSSVVEGIPALLHAALFLFFAGLVEFLFPINRTIAYTVLGAVLVCGFWYAIITVLPTILRNCPYRTPLSNMCWRFTQMLRRLLFKLFRFQARLRASTRMSVSISAIHLMSKMSMVEDMETLATKDSHERDIRALQWVMESLIEDSEFEPFVQGISTLLLGTSREKIGSGMSKTVLELLFDRKAKLLARTVRLLKTCEEPGALAKAPRRNRAIVCMDAITSIFHAFNSESSDLTPYPLPFMVQILESEWVDFAHTLAKLQKDEIPDIVFSTNSLAPVVVANLHTVMITGWGHVSPWLWSYVIRALDILDSIDHVFELLPTIAHSLEPSSMINSHPIIRLLRMKILPLYLIQYSHPGALSLENRQMRVMAYLKAIYVTACHFPCNGQFSKIFDSTARSLVALRNDDMPSIAHYASCTTARLAYHLQCDIIYWLEWGPQYIAGLVPCFRALDALQILRNLDGHEKADLRRQLMPGHVYSRSSSQSGLRRWESLHDSHRRTATQPSGEILRMSPEELECFRQEFQMCTTRGFVTADFRLSHKVYLSQAHIAVLVIFLQSLESSPLSCELLEVTTITIRLITRNLTARFSSHTAQSLLVRLIGNITANLACHDCLSSCNAPDAERVDGISNDLDAVSIGTHPSAELAGEQANPARGLVMEMIQALFGILGTIRDPESMDDAKAIVQAVINDSLTPELFRELAANTLRTVRMSVHCSSIPSTDDFYFFLAAGSCNPLSSSF
jgi:hypothetical protein